MSAPAATAQTDVAAQKSPTTSMEPFVETRSVQLEWKINNLKHHFESTKGEAKSKCIKSALFDRQQWQIFLYFNSGPEQYISLYLSAEPTALERELGIAEAEKGGWSATTGGVRAEEGGPSSTAVTASKHTASSKSPWKREGKFKFSFEARSADGKSIYKQMEANDHVFSDTAKNWGYSSYWKRSEAWFGNANVRAADAFSILCTIVYSPTPPTPPPPPRLLIPKDLVNAYASLFDDPDYADVCFIIRPAEKKSSEKRIYAAKKILAGRCEYFETMFNSGFYESNPIPVSIPGSATPAQSNASNDSSLPGRKSTYDDAIDSDDEENSDEDDEIGDWDEDDDFDVQGDEENSKGFEARGEDDEMSDGSHLETERRVTPAFNRSTSLVPERITSAAASDEEHIEDEEMGVVEGRQGEEDMEAAGVTTSIADKRRTAESDKMPFTDAVGYLTPPKAGNEVLTSQGRLHKTQRRTFVKAKRAVDGRPRAEVIVADAGYASFKALIYYLYTDSIVFTPLASTFHVEREAAQGANIPFPFLTRKAYLLASSSAFATPPIMACSAKAIYRLADKIGLPELKDRAYDHIVKSLTVQNIPYEVFGSFSLKFEEVKRVEIAFLLEKWAEVKCSPSMRKVFERIRTGQFPGFEDVWVRILENLEYRAPAVLMEEERTM